MEEVENVDLVAQRHELVLEIEQMGHVYGGVAQLIVCELLCEPGDRCSCWG
jgi:hypothetical protein